MLRLFRSSIVYQNVAITMALLILSAGAIVAAIDYNLKQSVMSDAGTDARDAARAMAVLSDMTVEGLDVVITDGELISVSAEAIPEFTSHDLVDRTAESIAGVATVFQTRGNDYVRISTNVKKEDGSRAVGTTLASDHPGQAFLARGEAYFGEATLFGRQFMTGYVPIKNAAATNVGILFIGIPMELYFAKLTDMMLLVAGVGVACMLIFGAIGFFLIRGQIRPMAVLANSVRHIADGDLSVEPPYQDRQNEFGEIGRALAVFRDNAIQKERVESENVEHRNEAEAERERNDAERQRADAGIATAVDALADGLEALARGDLTRQIDTPFSGRLEQLRVDFNTSVSRLREALGDISHNAAAIHAGAAEIRNASDDMSRRTERQAASVEQTAAALEEITATVRDSTRRAEEAGSLVGRTKAGAEQSGQLVRNAVEAMHLIDNSSREISSIIGVIDEIAFQTNLLALNAGVEAARAGEAGKGFAVVAQEVRALAQRSAEAAKEIKTLIMTSADQVASGVQLVGDTGTSLEAIVSEVKEINDHVTAIVTAAREQATALSEVNTAVNSIDQGTQQNAAMAEQSNAASHSLSREADALSALLSRFSLQAAASGEVVVLSQPLRSMGRTMREASNDSAPANASH